MRRNQEWGENAKKPETQGKFEIIGNTRKI
jgi:hypothetical protein